MLWTIVVWLFWLVVIGGAGLYVLATIWLVDHRRTDEIHYAKTDDGWDIAVHRLRPRNGKAKKIPVILQHGLAANHRNHDLEDRYSLGLYLAGLGYDCFLPDLRGAGDSMITTWHRRDRWHIGFADYVERDMPAIFAKVKELTKQNNVHYIGHSMGGMIGYAVAEGPLAQRVQSMTSIAGPAMFDKMTQFKTHLRYRWLLNWFPVLHNNVFMRIISPLAYFFPAIARTEVNPRNVEGPVIARAGANLIAPIPRKLLLEFGAWVEFGDWGAPAENTYQQRLNEITVPLYCLAGADDFWCPPRVIEQVPEIVAGEKKRYRLFSKANGDADDYGHGDFIVGRKAPEEVFPTIGDWLADNDPA